ncbi:MAG: glycosyltransferase [Elusimicrobia bacterium]|nr:MAG: glycosyltransferase [Elusimicrobiota bacterium]
MSLTSFLLGVGICHLLMALLVVWNRARTTHVALDQPLPTRPPTVHVLVPARNEESNIGDCIAALRAQDYPALRIRVIDDHSSDRTLQIIQQHAAEDLRVEPRQAPDLPKGWLGKPHALWSGSRDLTSDYVLFLDADVRLRPHAVRHAVLAALATQAGLVNMVPRLLAASFWERAAQPVIAQILFTFVDPVRVRDSESDFAVGYGPFMFFQRAAYEEIGGHAAVASEVVEDLRLAQRVKQARFPLAYVQGTNTVELRMYDSLRSLIAGWKKNFHIALGGAQWFAPIGALLLLLVYATPPVALLAALAYFAQHGGSAFSSKLLTVAALTYGADWLGRIALRATYGVTLRGVRGLGGALVAYILCASSYQAVMGRPVTWRGRSYPAA